MSFCEGRDGVGDDRKGSTGCGRIITGGAEKNCGDVGGIVTGVALRDGEGGSVEVIDVGIAVIRW